MRGILLIAAGTEHYYRMALNCAISIKAVSDIPVALAHGEEWELHYTTQELAYFDRLVPIADQYFLYEGKPNFSLLKLHLYHLSPFEETVYMDADSLALYQKPLQNLFSEASAYPLQFDIMDEKSVFSGSEEWDYFWYGARHGGLRKIRDTYGISDTVPMYQIQSSIAYFRKEPIVRQFFDTAIRVFYENKLGIVKDWSGWLLDELMFIVSQGIHRLEMQVPFKKVYYPYFDGYLSTKEQVDHVLNGYYFYSIPGIHSNECFTNLYNELIKEYYRHEKLDTSRMFLYQNKKEYMPERVSL